MYMKLPMYLFFKWRFRLDLMILSGANPLLGPLEEVKGPNGTRFARCNYRAPKSLDFQGPPLPVALVMD
jgi:hypothetical protein